MVPRGSDGYAQHLRGNALAGNQTQINCLEGSYADHYTTEISWLPRQFFSIYQTTATVFAKSLLYLFICLSPRRSHHNSANVNFFLSFHFMMMKIMGLGPYKLHCTLNFDFEALMMQYKICYRVSSNIIDLRKRWNHTFQKMVLIMN